MRILLVEDSPSEARLLAEELADAGHYDVTVEHVSRLRTAVERLRASRFDVVLLDLSLPDSSGLGTVAALRKEVHDVAIVVLTSTNDDELATKALRAGAQDYLVKGTVSGELVVRTARYSSERRRAELMLERRETEFRAVFESVLDAIVTVDEAGAIVEWNPAAERTFGYAREEVIGKPMAALIIPEARRQWHLDAFARAVETHDVSVFGDRFDTTAIRAGGHEFPVDIAIARVALPERQLFTACIRDITARKEAERRETEAHVARLESERRRARLAEDLQLLLDSAGEGVIGVSPEGVCTFANHAAVDALGFDRDQLVGSSTHETFHRYTSDGSPYPAEDCSVLSVLRGATAHADEDTFWRADGSAVPVAYSCHPIWRDERAEGAVIVFRDVSERRRAEKELRRSYELLQESDRERRQLLDRLVTSQEEERKRIAADIHDDSIQVMVAVGMRLDLLGAKVEDPASRESLERLNSEVTLAIERLRLLLFELRPPSLDHHGLGSALEEYLGQVAPQSGLAWSLSCSLPVEPATDVRVAVYRIVREAVANVRKHACASSVNIAIEPRDSGVYARIEDDGRGFSTDDDGGIHFGLKQMDDRAQLAGGWFRVESRPGSGTVVELWLPDLPLDDVATPAGVAGLVTAVH